MAWAAALSAATALLAGWLALAFWKYGFVIAPVGSLLTALLLAGPFWCHLLGVALGAAAALWMLQSGRLQSLRGGIKS